MPLRRVVANLPHNDDVAASAQQHGGLASAGFLAQPPVASIAARAGRQPSHGPDNNQDRDDDQKHRTCDSELAHGYFAGPVSGRPVPDPGANTVTPGGSALSSSIWAQVPQALYPSCRALFASASALACATCACASDTCA